MLGKCQQDQLELDDSPAPVEPFAVTDPEIEIVDEMSARFRARFDGPAGSKVIGRAWISDVDGTMIDGETGVIDAGSVAEMLLTIPQAKVQNGNLIACMRVEWPLYQTKHVIGWTLVEGGIVHPPKGKQC